MTAQGTPIQREGCSRLLEHEYISRRADDRNRHARLRPQKPPKDADNGGRLPGSIMRAHSVVSWEMLPSETVRREATCSIRGRSAARGDRT